MRLWGLLGAGVVVLGLLGGCAASGLAVKDAAERDHTYAVVVKAPDYIYINTLATTIFQNKSWKFEEPEWRLSRRMTDRVVNTVEKTAKGAVPVPQDLSNRIVQTKRPILGGEPKIGPELAQLIAQETGADRLLYIQVENTGDESAGTSAEAARAGALRFQRAYMGTRHASTTLLANIDKYDLPSGQLRRWGGCAPRTLDDPNPWFSSRDDVTPEALSDIEEDLVKLADTCVDQMMVHMYLQQTDS